MTHVHVRSENGFQVLIQSSDRTTTLNRWEEASGKKGDIHLGVVESVGQGETPAKARIDEDLVLELPGDEVLPAYGERRWLKPGESRLRLGQVLLVQRDVERKGCRREVLTTHVTVASEYLVLMPGNPTRNVSNKITNPDEKDRLLAILHSLAPPPSMGYVIRTNAEFAPPDVLRRDLLMLLEDWRDVAILAKKATPPCKLYRNAEFVFTRLRRALKGEVTGITVDCDKLARRIQRFIGAHHPDLSFAVEHDREAVLG